MATVENESLYINFGHAIGLLAQHYYIVLSLE